MPPVPTISIAASSDSTIAGNLFTLTCSVINIPDITPVLTWTGPGMAQSNVQLSSSSTALALIFNPLRTSNGGIYTCEVRLNFTLVGVSDFTSNITQNIIVQSKSCHLQSGTISHSITLFVVPTPVVSIVEHPIPYNGTVFTLSGIAQLNHSVDTNVTAVGIWTDNDSPQVTTSPPYLTSLEFQPLTSDSSKEYTLNITLRPTDNSSFVTVSNASIIYSLIVQRKFKLY